MALREYQSTFTLNTIYNINLRGGISGLGEALKPRITSVGGTLTVYGSEEKPTGATVANIATKMALISDDVAIEAFESLPNYICAIQKSGASTELVLTCIEKLDAGTVIA